MRIVKAALVYFAVVLGAGFVLGFTRTLWIAPRVGARLAELLEAPLMLAIIIVTARWIVKKFAGPFVLLVRLGTGLIALGFMLLAEFTLVQWLRGISIRQYFATRDPVAASVYYALLGVFALMPLIGKGEPEGQES